MSEAEKKVLSLPDEIYRDTFVRSPSGVKVLEDLTRNHYDRSCFVQGDPYTSAFNEGRRAVVLEILSRCALTTKGA